MSDKRRPTVWVLKEQVKTGRDGTPAVFDYTPLYEYGNIEFITTFDPPITPSVTLIQQWESEVKAFMDRYDPEHDWIVPTGSPHGIFKLGHRLGLAVVHPRMLIWQNRSARYFPMTGR